LAFFNGYCDYESFDIAMFGQHTFGPVKENLKQNAPFVARFIHSKHEENITSIIFKCKRRSELDF